MASVNMVRARKLRRRSASVERYLPLLYVALAGLAVTVLLPSALRPPQQHPNQTAELSPDAPPDDSQTAIISSLNRSSSGVATEEAGAGGGGDPTLPPTTEPPAPPTTLVPRACPRGVGDPPRQVESVYAPPCAPPFSGDNGGSTYRGVSRNEIKIGVRGLGSRGGGNGDCNANGRVDDMIRSGTNLNSNVRHWYNLQQYFNRNFQLYGRQLVFYCVEPESLSPSDEARAAVQAVQEYGIFANPFSFSNACMEYARAKVISFCPQMPERFYQENDPYLWSAWPGGGDIGRFSVEYICKKLNGKPAEYAGRDLKGKPRKFVMITWDDRGYGEDAHNNKRMLKERCGADLHLIFIRPGSVWGGEANSDAEIAAAATKAKAEEATTVFFAVDSISAAQLTAAADANNYEPEWYVSDAGGLNINGVAAIQSPNQWKRAFGLSGWGPDLPIETTECARAYREIDQTNTPNWAICRFLWTDIMLMMAGIQQAGPNLNPQTFKQGLLGLGVRHWNHSTSQGGGFLPTRHSYLVDVAEIWFDPNAADPSARSSVGAYKYLYDGRRFCQGQLNGDTSRLFKEGVTLPSDVGRIPAGPPAATCPPV